MRKFRLCPNCGHTVFGTKCEWCHYILTNDRPAKEEAEQQTLKVVEHLEQTAAELLAKAKTEAHEKPTTMVVIDAQEKARRIVHAAEQIAQRLSSKALSSKAKKLHQPFVPGFQTFTDI